MVNLKPEEQETRVSAKTLQIANALGAKIVGHVPDAGPGAFGAARLRNLVADLRARLQPSFGERPGRPTESTWDRRPKVPMSQATEEKLRRLAELASTPERKVSPMQMAAHLLEKALAEVPER
jgi:hypothetical protein